MSGCDVGVGCGVISLAYFIGGSDSSFGIGADSSAGFFVRFKCCCDWFCADGGDSDDCSIGSDCSCCGSDGFISVTSAGTMSISGASAVGSCCGSDGFISVTSAGTMSISGASAVVFSDCIKTVLSCAGCASISSGCGSG